MTVPIVHEPGSGEAAALGSLKFSIKAGTEETEGAYSFTEASGPVSATPHIHRDREEAFYVLEGTVVFLAGEERIKGNPGSFVLIPRGLLHGFRSDGESKLIIIHSPGGFEGFFKESFAALERGEFGRDMRDRLADKFGMTYFDDVTI